MQVKKSSGLKLVMKVKKSVPPARSHDSKGGGSRSMPGEECVFTGIAGLDSLLGSGIPRGSAVLVEGGPGSGKTLFTLQVAVNFCKRGQKVLYMSFEEPEARLRAHIASFGWKVSEYESNGLLVIRRFDELDIARSVEALLSAAKKELLIEVQPMLLPDNFMPDLVIVDSLTSIASAFSGEESRFRIYMEQLFRYFEKTGTTSLLIREVASPAHVGRTYVEKGEAISFLSDGIIVIYNVAYDSGARGRAIEVLKLRGSDIKRKIVGLDITKKGIVVNSNRSPRGKFELT